MKAEELEKSFSPIRLALLIRNHALGELPAALIAAGIAFGVNLVGLLLSGMVIFNDSNTSPGQSPLWSAGIALFGLYFASRAFSGMHGAAASDWILLPASVIEKFTASAIWVLVVWPIVASVGSMACSGILVLLAQIGSAKASVIWTPFSAEAFDSFIGYITIAPVLMAGSAVFVKRPLMKTFGIVVAAIVVVTLIAVAYSNAVLGGGGLSFNFSFNNGVFSADGHEGLVRIEGTLKAIMSTWAYGVLPIFALAFTYFRIAEKEARDAVQ